MNLEAFLTIAIVHFLGVISPGPDIIAITRYAINNGMNGVKRFAAGIVIGQFVYLFASIFGLTKIIFKFYYFKLAFYLFSGFYLFYLGLFMIRRKTISDDKSHHEIKKHEDPLKMAILITISNPNAAIFYSSILTNFISETSSNFSLILLMIYLTVATFSFFYASAFVFSKMKDSVNKYRIILDKIFGSILIYFSLKLFYSVITGI